MYKHFPYHFMRWLDVLPFSASEMIIKFHTGLETDLCDRAVSVPVSLRARTADFIPF